MKLVLCYVAGCWAYFTTQELSEQWGDDWNDAPYEHNAGDPYEFDEHDAKRGKEPWQIMKVAFEVNLEPPDAWASNSPYSVQDINNKVTPWLQSGRYGKRDENDEPIQIWAGTSIDDFIKLIEKAKGDVYLKATPSD